VQIFLHSFPISHLWQRRNLSAIKEGLITVSFQKEQLVLSMVAQDRFQWLAFLNTVMTPQVP
jgi:hypothetical protein